MQVCTSLQTDNGIVNVDLYSAIIMKVSNALHTSTSPLSFLQAGCPSCRPTNSIKALKALEREVILCNYADATCRCLRWVSWILLVGLSFLWPRRRVRLFAPGALACGAVDLRAVCCDDRPRCCILRVHSAFHQPVLLHHISQTPRLHKAKA